MRIGIDARMMGKGFGLARYIEQLILHLQIQDTENEYIIFLKRDNFDTFEPTNSNFKKVLADISWYSFEEQLKFPWIIRKAKVDVMHFPHFNVPVVYSGPYIVTIHDLIMFHYPRQEASTHGPFVYWVKDFVHRLVVRSASRRAKHILVTSEFTKCDVHETLGVAMEKMTVTYQAPFANAAPSNVGTSFILSKYKITKPYLLYVGAAYPHKNLDGLLEAWEIFQKKYGKEYQLVLVGKENFFYTKLKNTLIKESNDVIYTGFVPDDELSVLYQKTLLYVFPSFYEGFGLPPLEAMTRGVPVVSSNASCMPEVLQDAALYFDPKNLEEMADTLYKCIIEDPTRLKLQENARKLLLKYSWKVLAEKTLHLYNQ
ncbi:MAG: hypothetical protein A3B90_02150 [Candidatus Magasanikbacteria bacterium RIFCSPHIGHO2_02_FULL_41_13]|uniref:Glycosyl transferase family 1 domain-containing protein n=1 Tax=Candidatus Magasanikbacteria bacterium RIFCSPHIGHO2_02_FULL_41_13 TaxID=1798676 RepID=A0A1F6M5V3_9BACT|nr:MAG: hypothetical protein A3B90_02150 [Candidatus Magasanikbacteria bacterium RIFCSPHIGHO2_02_FULL_41_13]